MSEDRLAPSQLPLPLQGIRVLDCTHIVAGPFCSMLLGDAGAEVIKIERPVTSDRARQSRPFFRDSNGEQVSGRFLAINRNKKSLTLNLGHPQGKEAFLELVALSDVVLDNYGPGALQRVGLGYQELASANPAIIYASITGYGNSDQLAGPYSYWPAHNPCVQGMVGWMSITGSPDGPPQMVGDNIGDSVPAVWTAYGIMLALHSRALTGLGQQVDMAMYDCMVMHNTSTFPFYQALGEVPGRQRQTMTSAQLPLKTSDGYVVLAGAVGEQKWSDLWTLLGRPELAQDPRYLGRDVDGSFYFEVITPLLQEWTHSRTKVEVSQVFNDLGFSSVMVQDAADMMACSHLEARQMFVEMDYATVTGKFRAPASPVKLSRSAPMPVGRPPGLGEHTEEVLTGLLGLTQDQIDELKAQGAV